MDGWISTKDQMPAEGQEVTVATRHGQIKQVVRDSKYAGGYKQANCHGWECVGFDPDNVSHWRPQIVARPSKHGPKDAPWMTDNAALSGSGGTK